MASRDTTAPERIVYTVTEKQGREALCILDRGGYAAQYEQVYSRLTITPKSLEEAFRAMKLIRRVSK